MVPGMSIWGAGRRGRVVKAFDHEREGKGLSGFRDLTPYTRSAFSVCNAVVVCWRSRLKWGSLLRGEILGGSKYPLVVRKESHGT